MVAAPITTATSLPAFFARSIVPGLVGTMLIATSAISLGWVPLNGPRVAPPLIDVLQQTTFGIIAAAVALLVGVVILLLAWLQLGSDLSASRSTDVRRLWMTLGIWSAPLLLTHPLFSRDVYSYVAQGKLMANGLNPYLVGPSVMPGWMGDGVDPLWADATSPYGQVFLLIGRFFAEVTGSNPYGMALLFRLLALAGVVLLAWAVPVLAKAYGINPARALWLGVLNPLVFLHFVSGAHNDALMVGLIAAGFALVVRKQPYLGILLITLAAAVKPVGLLALPFAGLMWAGQGAPMTAVAKRWLQSALVAVAVFVGLAAASGTGFGWLNAVGTPASVNTWLSPPTAVGMLLGGVVDARGFDLTDTLIAVFRLLATIAALVIIAHLCLRPGTRNPVRAAGLAFLVLVILGPVVQPWYLLWSGPLLAATALTKVEIRWMTIGTVGLTVFSLGSHLFDGAGYV
jgi:alpha-1,6-mannosyltransferase